MRTVKLEGEVQEELMSGDEAALGNDGLEDRVENDAAPQDDPEKQFDMRTLSMRDKVSAYNRPPEDSALLSEAWKESEADAAGGPGLGAALKGAALAVALAAFSQVPLGKQDVSIPANDPSRVPVTSRSPGS